MPNDDFPLRTTWHLPTKRIGQTVQVFPEVDSTNTRAAEAIGETESDGLAFLADRQHAGRGQHGRTWLAPPGSSVLLSLLLHPPPPLSRPALLTTWAAVSVCMVVAFLTKRHPRIKWPNDVLVEERKVCGILIEQRQQGERRATVVGIGLNVMQTSEDFSRAGLPDATSLNMLLPIAPATEDVARLLLHTLDAMYDQLITGDMLTLQQRWREHLGLVGEHVYIECAGSHHTGQLTEATLDALTLARPGKPPLILAPEVILHIERV